VCGESWKDEYVEENKYEERGSKEKRDKVGE